MKAEEYASRLLYDGLRHGWLTSRRDAKRPRSPKPSTARARGGSRTSAPILNGVKSLEAVLRKANYRSVVAAVAEFTVFLHPTTVAQTRGEPLFPVIRDMVRRGEFATLSDGRRVLLDDNTSPTRAFLWAAERTKGADVQFNHVWIASNEVRCYTALWNICATPAFLAKTTDGRNHPDVTAALRYRSFELFGHLPPGSSLPERPSFYEELVWAPSPPPVADLEVVLRRRLASNPRSRPALAAREIGWLFSSWQPDPTIGVAG
jgi:hypothetical protein